MEESSKIKLGDVVEKINDSVDLNERNGMFCVRGGHVPADVPVLLGYNIAGNEYLGPAFHRKFETGDVLFTSRVPHKVGLATFSGICANTTLVLRSKDPVLTQKMLPNLLQTNKFKSFLKSISRGSTNPFVNWTQLANFQVYIPSISKQKNIVEIIDNIDVLIQNKLRSVELIGMIKRKLFSSHLKSYSGEKLMRFDETWKGSPEGGHTPKSVKHPTGSYVLTLACLGRDGFVPNQVKPILDTEGHRKNTLEKGDLLISRSNTIQLVGRCCIIPQKMSNTSFGDLFFRINFDEESIIPSYAMYLLQSDMGVRYIRSISAGTSGSMKKINRKNLGKLMIPIVPIIEQKELLRGIDKLESIRSRASIEVEKLVQARSQILEKILEKKS